MRWGHETILSLKASTGLLLFLSSYCTAGAQLCNGSLGDPVVNIDFGSGKGRGATLGPLITNYEYMPAGELDEGVYTIASTTEGLKGEAWHVTSDHTGDPDGYMLIANCAILGDEGIFYTNQVLSLCKNTTYEFSAWIMNTMTKVSPNPKVTFRVNARNGIPLGEFKTGELPYTSKPEWKQYGFFFNTGSETSVTIAVLNSTPSAKPGNDLALDDIQFRPCGPDLNVSIDGGGILREMCKKDNSIFTFTGTISSGYNDPVYQWQQNTDSIWSDIEGANNTFYTRQPNGAPGNYLYRLTAVEKSDVSSITCRVASDNLTISVPDDPLPEAASNKPGCLGDTLKLNASDIGISYEWTGPNNFTENVRAPSINSITSANNGTYRVKLTTALGCIGFDSLDINISDPPSVNAGNDIAICEGSSVVLQGSGSSNSFSWFPTRGLSRADAAKPVARPTDSTAYILTVSNGNCKQKDTVMVAVWKKPVADAGVDQTIYEGNTVKLNGQASGTDINYYWTNNYHVSNTSALNPQVAPAKDTTYTLHVLSAHGCIAATDNVFVRVFNKITIPNAFSPNNDGTNDTWSISKLSTYRNSDISVFNRYGQLVFQSRGYSKEWDGRSNGKPLPVGTYYYVINLKEGFKNTTGWVAILR